MFSIILLTLLYIFIRGLHFIYLFQIKEYRADRLISTVKEEGILKAFYFSKNRFPGRSMRNLILSIFLLLWVLLLFLLALEEYTLYIFLTFGLLIAPWIAFIIISVGVYLTEIPAQMYRSLLIMRAYMKVKNSRTVFIGVTGSFGKTSVKEFIAHILAGKFNVKKTEKNMNTNVGVAISILNNLDKKTDFFIAEFGAYRAGEIKKASWYIPLKYAILTGLGNQHVDLYGSREILIQEESSLLYQVPDDGTVYINADIPSKEMIIKHLSAKKIIYGMYQADIKAKILSMHPMKVTAKISYNGYDFVIETHLLGDHSVINLLPAIAIALDIGMKPREIIEQIQTLQPLEGKLSVHIGRAKATIINDAVNSNVDGFIAAIRTLHRFPEKTKYIISQGIIELGVEKRASYERILQELYKTSAKLFTTDLLFQQLDSENRVMIFNDVSDIQKKLTMLLNKHSVLLLEGKFPKPFLKELLKKEI